MKVMSIELRNDTTEEIPALTDRKQLEHSFTLVANFPSGTAVATKSEFQGIGIQAEEEAIEGKYYLYTLRSHATLGTTNEANEVMFGGVAIGGSSGLIAIDESRNAMMLAIDADIVVDATSITRAISGAGITVGGSLFSTSLPVVSEAKEGLRVEGPPGNVCDSYLLGFSQYAREILKTENIEVINTQIRNWQAIDDSSWKQCILDITIKAEPDRALIVWEELAKELEDFIGAQDADVRPLLEGKITLDVKWT